METKSIPLAESDSTIAHPTAPSELPPDIEAGTGFGHSDGEKTSKESIFRGLGWLDRFLALWIFLAMAIGILLGNFVPNTGPALQKGEFVGVSIPISESPLPLSERTTLTRCQKAVGLLVMMYPILCKIRFETLHKVFSHREIWFQILFSIVVNWIVAPFVMVGHLSL